MINHPMVDGTEPGHEEWLVVIDVMGLTGKAKSTEEAVLPVNATSRIASGSDVVTEKAGDSDLLILVPSPAFRCRPVVVHRLKLN